MLFLFSRFVTVVGLLLSVQILGVDVVKWLRLFVVSLALVSGGAVEVGGEGRGVSFVGLGRSVGGQFGHVACS